MCTNARNVKYNQKKNQSVETDVEMTEIMELSHRSMLLYMFSMLKNV